MAKAVAYINGKEYVVPDDIRYVMPSVISHRLMLSAKGKAAFGNSENIANEVAKTVAVPVR